MIIDFDLVESFEHAFSEHKINRPKFSDPIEVHADYLIQLIYRKSYASLIQLHKDPLSIETIVEQTKTIEKPTISRMFHGGQHVTRVALWIKCLIETHRLFKTPDIDTITVDDIKLLQIAALLHDSGREDEGTDYWDVDSAHNFYYYTIKILGLSPERVMPFVLAIADKDFIKRIRVSQNRTQNTDSDLDLDDFQASSTNSFNEVMSHQLNNEALCEDKYVTHHATISDDGQLILNHIPHDGSGRTLLTSILHDADCLDIMRVKSIFNSQYLDIYKVCCDKNKGIISDDKFEFLSRLISHIRHFIYQHGDHAKNVKSQLKDFFELHASTFQSTLEHLLSRPKDFSILHALITTDNVSLSELSLRGMTQISDSLNCEALPELNRQMLNGEVYLRGITKSPIINIRHHSHTPDKDAQLSHAEYEIQEIFLQGNFQYRSTVLPGFGTSAFSPAGLIILPQDDQIYAFDSRDTCTGFGKKEHVFLKCLSLDEKLKAKRRLLARVKISDDGIGYSGSNHNECIISLYPQSVVGIYYTLESAYFYQHDPNMNLFEAVYIQSLFKSMGIELNVYCYDRFRNQFHQPSLDLSNLTEILEKLSLIYLDLANFIMDMIDNLPPDISSNFIHNCIQYCVSLHGFFMAHLTCREDPLSNESVNHNLGKHFPFYSELEHTFFKSPIILQRRSILMDAIFYALFESKLGMRNLREDSKSLQLRKFPLMKYFSDSIHIIINNKERLNAEFNEKFDRKLHEHLHYSSTIDPRTNIFSYDTLHKVIKALFSELKSLHPVPFYSIVPAHILSEYFSLLIKIHPIIKIRDSKNLIIKLLYDAIQLTKKICPSPHKPYRPFEDHLKLLAIESMSDILSVINILKAHGIFDIDIENVLITYLFKCISFDRLKKTLCLHLFSSRLQFEYLSSLISALPASYPQTDTLLGIVCQNSPHNILYSLFGFIEKIHPTHPVRVKFIDIHQDIISIHSNSLLEQKKQDEWFDDFRFTFYIQSLETGELLNILNSFVPCDTNTLQLISTIIRKLHLIIEFHHAIEILSFFEQRIFPKLIDHMRKESPTRMDYHHFISLGLALRIIHWYSQKYICLPEVISGLMICTLNTKPSAESKLSYAQTITQAYPEQQERLLVLLESLGINTAHVFQRHRADIESAVAIAHSSPLFAKPSVFESGLFNLNPAVEGYCRI